MSIFDALKSIATTIDPKLFDGIIAKLGGIDFAPIIKNMEGKAKGDNSIATVLNLLKNLSAAKPATAKQLTDITSKFNAKELTSGLNKVENMDDLPGMNIISQALKTFIK